MSSNSMASGRARNARGGAAGEAKEMTSFVLDMQDRLLEVVEEQAAEIAMGAPRYIRGVVRTYKVRKPQLVRPEPGSVRPLSKGRTGQAFPTARRSIAFAAEAVEWLDSLGERTGGFNRSHTVILLLLKWFGIDPFEELFAFMHRAAVDVSPGTTTANRIKTTFSCQARLLEIVRETGEPTPWQQYVRTVLTSYAKAEGLAARPKPGVLPALSKARAGREFERETVGFYFSSELLDWLDEIGNRAGGFNRSHVIMLLLLDWFRINPFAEFEI
jgi:hypothetical protein